MNNEQSKVNATHATELECLINVAKLVDTFLRTVEVNIRVKGIGICNWTFKKHIWCDGQVYV